MTKITLFIAFLLFVSGNVLFAESPKGTVKGTIVFLENDAESPAPFVNVYLADDPSKGVSTDFDGNYVFELEAGERKLVFSSTGFKADTLTVYVSANENVVINHTLKSNDIIMKGVDVVTKANRETEAIQMLERKSATVLQANIGSREMSKKGASNAADGLKKIAGISMVGGRYFLVRGMGDRYNNASLNGMPIASPDPDRKVIALDIFPTGVIQSLALYKSFSPELYGDFAGGTVDIRTKDYPTKPTLTIGTSVGGNTQTTFRNFMTYEGSQYDYWGFGANDRGYADVLDTPEGVGNNNYYESNHDAVGNVFAANNNPIYTKAPLNTGVNVLFGNRYGSDKRNVGVLVSASHGNSYQYQLAQYKLVNKQNVQNNFLFDKYTQSTNSSVLASVNTKLNERNKIAVNSLWVNLTSDNARDAYGKHYDLANDGNQLLFTRRFTYLQNSVWSNQILGEHELTADKRLVLNWAQSYNKATSIEPDRREVVFKGTTHQHSFNNENFDSEFDRSYLSDYNYTPSNDNLSDNSRFFGNLDEVELASKVELAYKLKMYTDEPEKTRWSIKVGSNIKRKTRNFDYRQFEYNLKNFDVGAVDGVDAVDLDNIDALLNEATHNDGLFHIVEFVDASAKQASALSVNAGYLLSDFDLIPHTLKMLTGLRIENSQQSIAFKNQVQPSKLMKNSLNGTYLLPSLSFKYTPSKQNLWWLTATKTMSRPGFKEVAPFEYMLFFSGEKVRGNFDLQNGTNYNVDLRYEHYATPSELLSIAAFGKYLENPIERVNYASSSRKSTFVNIDGAYIAGVEAEINKKMFTSTNFKHSLLLGGNATLLYSQVSIGDATSIADPITGNPVSVVVTNTERALQGASPYLINADLTYQYTSEKVKTSLALVYNVAGKRITSVGVKANGGDGVDDVYELAVHRLDLIAKAKFNNQLGVNLGVKNILNPHFITQQQTDSGLINLSDYQRGVQFNLGISYDLFNENK